MKLLFQHAGMISGVAMPFFNIPLIWRVIQRRSSADISLIWVIGVEVCVLGMFPSTLVTTDSVLRGFGLVNSFFFSIVFVVVLYFHPSVRNAPPPKE